MKSRSKVSITTLLSLFVSLVLYYGFTFDSIWLQDIYTNKLICVVIFILPLILVLAQMLKGRCLYINEAMFGWAILFLIVALNIYANHGLSILLAQYNLVWLCSCLFMIYLPNYSKWQLVAFRTTLIVTSVHAALGWIFYLQPKIYSMVVLSHAVEPYKSGLQYVVGNGALVGLANFYSITGMYISVGYIAAFAMAFVTKKKGWYLYALILMITLFLTYKRGVTLFSILTTLFLFVTLSAKTIREYIKAHVKLFLGMVGMALLFMVLSSTILPNLQGIVVRTQALIQDGNISANRFTLWAAAYEQFLKSPMWGIGWQNFSNVTGMAETCSSYLEVLCSLGIWGFLAFVFAVFSTLYYTGKQVKKSIRMKEPSKDNQKIVLIFAYGIQILFLLYSLTGEAIILPAMYIPYFVCCAIGLSKGVVL